MKIKIMMVHNHYKQNGGEDQVLENEKMLLEKNNEEVFLYKLDNDSIKSDALTKAKVGINSIWSISQYLYIRRLLRKIKPDVVHVHNFFPLISPSVYAACNSLNIPVVQTLHNYRLICPAATFLRDGKICEKCLTGSLINAVRYGCYRDSKAQTIPVASMIALNRLFNTWTKYVTKYISLTEFSKSKFVSSGIPSQKIEIKPNFVHTNNYPSYSSKRENYVLFVGRISKEKGVRYLLEAWLKVCRIKNTKLIIIGDGPDKEYLETHYKDPSIVFKGKKDKEEVLKYISKAMYLVVPSIWYEGFPMTIIESYSLGTPVICSSIGSLKEVVTSYETGFHFEPANIENIEETIVEALEYQKKDEMIGKTLNVFNERYSASSNYNQLSEIYRSAIEENVKSTYHSK